MGYGISFASVAIIVLDILMIRGCWAVDRHLKLLASDDQLGDPDDVLQSQRFPLFSDFVMNKDGNEGYAFDDRVSRWK